MSPDFEILEHPSDIGVKAYGKSMEELFLHAAQGLISIITETSKIQSRESRTVFVPALDRENLLVRWLTEILYLYDAEKFLTCNAKFTSLSDNSLKAIVYGERYISDKHNLKLDVKAITYHQLKIEVRDGIWIAYVFVDI